MSPKVNDIFSRESTKDNHMDDFYLYDETIINMYSRRQINDSAHGRRVKVRAAPAAVLTGRGAVAATTGRFVLVVVLSRALCFGRHLAASVRPRYFNKNSVLSDRCGFLCDDVVCCDYAPHHHGAEYATKLGGYRRISRGST